MNIYRRYFKVQSGPLIDAVKEHKEIMDDARSEYAKICEEIGADQDKYYQSDGILTGFIFSKNDADNKIFKKTDYGWTPRRNTKVGKELAKKVSNVKTSKLNSLLPIVGLSDSFFGILCNGRSYRNTIVIIPSEESIALISVPWYDENPEVIEQYKIDKTDNARSSANLDAILWEPTSDMEEIKEWQYSKEIDDWNESVKSNEEN